MPSLDELERTLLDKTPSASVEDLGKIASAMKEISEVRNADVTARIKQRETRLEVLKSLSAFLIPLVSLLALLATVYSQGKQIEASRQQIEDTEWRDLLGSLKGSSDSVYSDLTVAPRLRSFFASPTYADQAKSIAIRLMGHISNSDGFRDLFGAVFGEVDAGSIGSLLGVSRALHATTQSVWSSCNALLGAANTPYDPGLVNCGGNTDEATALELMKKLKAPVGITPLRHQSGQIYEEKIFLNTKIAPFIRANYQIADGRKPPAALNISETEFINEDFSNLDLTDFNIAGTLFDQVNFSNAILSPKTDTASGQQMKDGTFFPGATWWEAQSIEAGLLGYLIDKFPPYAVANTLYPAGYRITSEAYQAKVRALCRRANMACPATLKFGRE